MKMAFTRLYLIPLAITFLIPCTCLVTYICAVSFDQVTPMLPYISDTATFAPESCFFAQAMNIIAILNLAFAWVRYSHVKVACSTEVKFACTLRLNTLAYWHAMSTSVGMSMVANFSETGSFVMHCVGASFLFLPSLAYVWIQVVISMWTINVISSRMAATARLILGILGALFMIIGMVSTPIAFYLFHGEDFRKWKPDDGGYEFHLASTFSEWFICLGYPVFVATFVAEFQNIQIENPEVGIYSENGTRSPKYSSLPGSSNAEPGV